MINSFTIKNFRLFQTLEISRFGQVNLLVGKNNSGKTALLEALEIYTSNASTYTIRNLIAGREETWDERVRSELQEDFVSPLRHLFARHRLPAIGEEGIILGSIHDPAHQMAITTAAFQTVADEEGLLRRRMLTPEEAANSEFDIEIALVVQEAEKTRRLISISGKAALRPPARSQTEIESKCALQIVPTRNMTAQKIASLWDLIGLTALADEVISGLCLIEPAISGILFVENHLSTQQSRTALVSLANASEPLPLKSMGDGITRLFHIIVALVSAKNGILLIDEFENGLHWSVQSAVWKTIFRLAAHLNVQVFATTHSRDCVAGFEEAWSEYPENGAFFRLQLSKENVPTIKSYSLETLADSLDTDVEVR